MVSGSTTAFKWFGKHYIGVFVETDKASRSSNVWVCTKQYSDLSQS